LRETRVQNGKQAKLFRFLVVRVLAARTAEFSGLHTFGVLLLVFGGGVVAIFALTTLQCNDFAHFPDSF
jgi:hypothetical protein